MILRRYWVDDRLEVDIPFAISGDLFKHIHIVCRQNLGDDFEILSSGKVYLVKVKDIHKSVMVVDVIKEQNVPTLSRPHIHLALSLPKIKTLEDVVEKVVELGVYSFHPFYSDFSFFKSKDRIQEKTSRLRKIVLSACQQSARVEEMMIHPTVSMKDLLERVKNESLVKEVRSYAFYEGKAKSLKAQLDAENNQIEDKSKVTDIWIFIGSEGGFSSPEIDLFNQYEIPSLSVGAQVLRVETACVSIVSVLKYHYDLV